jgi:hypothetical protein
MAKKIGKSLEMKRVIKKKSIEFCSILGNLIDRRLKKTVNFGII